MKRRHLLGLTQAERNMLAEALGYFLEALEVDAKLTGAERAMSDRLVQKLRNAPRVTDRQLHALDRAAGNFLDDPTVARDQRVMAAYAARWALWRAAE